MYNKIKSRIEKIFKESFEVDRLEDSMSIENVKGWDSMAHVGLILALQKEFGVSITPAEAIELTSIRNIIRYLSDRAV
jgi:acyl carrier protein